MGTTALEVDFLCSGILGTNNKPLASGKVYCYSAGTSNLNALYSAADKSASCANPIILDSRGAATAYGDGYYKFVIKDKNDVTISTYDNMYYVVPQTEAVTVRSISTSGLTTASTPEMIEVNTAGGAITLNLVTAITHAGLEFIIVKTNAGGSTLTVDADGSETISGVGTKAMTGTLEVLHIMSDGSNWIVVNEPSGSAITATSTDTLTNKTLTTPVIASFYQDAGKTKLMTTPDTASDTLAAIAATQTLTNKTLTTPVIASFYQDAGKTKLMTTPNTASDTLCAIAATQTLTNKTLTAPVLGGNSTLAAGADIYTTAWTDYFASSTIAGWAAGKTGTIYYKVIGKMMYVHFYITGTADSSDATFTVPTALAAAMTALYQPCYAYTGGAALASPALVYMSAANTTTVTLYDTWAYSLWVTSGTRTVQGNFWYPVD